MSKKSLFFDRETAERIAQTVPTPFYIYDEKGIREAVRRLAAAFGKLSFKEFFHIFMFLSSAET